MPHNEKFKIQRRNTLRNLWQKLSGTPEFPVKLVLAALYLMGAAYVCVKQAAWRTLAGNIPLISPLLKAAMEHALTAYLLAGAATLPVLLLYPFGRRAAKDQLQGIGLVNHAGMPPDLLRKRREKDNPRVTIWEFRNNSIPLQEWEKRQAAIEMCIRDSYQVEPYHRQEDPHLAGILRRCDQLQDLFQVLQNETPD